MATNIDMVGTAYGMEFSCTDPRWTPTDVVNPVVVATFTATQDLRTLDAFLTATNAGYWTALRLAQESLNDKMFWVRSQVPAGLS